MAAETACAEMNGAEMLTPAALSARARRLLAALQVATLNEGEPLRPGISSLTITSPLTGTPLATLAGTEPAALDAAIGRAAASFRTWRLVPAPARGNLVGAFAQGLRRHRQLLAELITLETGKITAEALGEVQEAIDICDFALGLSRQLHGLTIASERPQHRMMET